MQTKERTSGDIVELEQRASVERDALRRDRYRAVLLALEGQEAVAIAAALGRARRSVQDWAYAYRDGGVEAIQPKPRPGRKPKLPRDREGDLTHGWTPGRVRTMACARCGARMSFAFCKRSSG